MDHAIQGLMKTALENLNQMVDVNTIVGDPIETPDGGVILTVSRVGFGFGAGGSDFKTSSVNGIAADARNPFGGGSGAGVSISPVAFLVVKTNGVKLLHIDRDTHIYEKLIELAPQAIEKIQQLLQKNNNNDNNSIDDLTTM
ncbi:MAG: sporulation protein YtfJ [Bacillales bacterium]|jgi:sporulation protein YtfJ|nr:sporulation protein YtfJ [Bacillales bacterium]